jgi:hypothetical protein
MEQKASMKVGLLRETTGDYEIVSNGRHVWVNDEGRCVARFTTIGQEIMGRTVCLHGTDGPNAEHWSDFVTLVYDSYFIVVEDKHRPQSIVIH